MVFSYNDILAISEENLDWYRQISPKNIEITSGCGIDFERSKLRKGDQFVPLTMFGRFGTRVPSK
jgi:hypothetical protein